MKKPFYLICTLFALLLLFSACDSTSEDACPHEDLYCDTVLPSCDSEGFTAWKCADCPLEYKTDTRPSTGHNPIKTVTAPTCEKEGYTTYRCIECNYRYRSDTVAPTGHTLVRTVTPATCTAEGSTLYTCNCGYSYTSDYEAPLGHAFSSTKVPPTCTESGYTLLTCTVCKTERKTDFKEPLGHDEETVVTPATCTKAGYTEQICLRCPNIHRTEYEAPLGHSFSTSIIYPTRTSAGALLHTCQCGHEISEPLLYGDVFTGAYSEEDAPLARGVDVSRYQHFKTESGAYLPLDWTTIKASGFDFAILQAGSTPRQSSEGTPVGGMDPVFEMNYLAARTAGMELGVYFYTYAESVAEAKADALLLISWLKDKQLEYPVYLDIEDPSLTGLGKDLLTEICVTFISTLQENGFYGALYANNDWLVNYLHADILKPLCDIWYARYPLAGEESLTVTPEDTFIWNTELYGATLGMWQYTNHGTIEGIDGIEFDFDYVYRDYPSIIKKYGYNGFSVEPLSS